MTSEKNVPTTVYAVSADESRRIQILKLWLSVMVVFIHSYTEEVHFATGDIVMRVPLWLYWIKYVLSQVVSRCAVPCFFLLAGLFLYRKPFGWKENVKKKAKTLLIPYLFLNTFWLVFYYVAQRIPALSVYFSNPDNIIANFTLSDFANAYLGFKSRFRSEGLFPFLYPLWFLRDLMVLNLLAVPIKRLIDHFPAVLALFCALLLLKVDLSKAIFCLRTDSLVFFSLGYYCVKYNRHPSDLDKLGVPLLAATYCLLILLVCALKDTPFQHLAGTLVILVGIAFFYRCCTHIKNARIEKTLVWLSQYNFSIYLFHEMNLGIIKKLVTRFLPVTPVFQLLTYLGIPVVVISFCVAVSVFLERFEPRFYRLLTGGRTR